MTLKRSDKETVALVQSKYIVAMFLMDGAPREVNVDNSLRLEIIRQQDAYPECKTLFKGISGMLAKCAAVFSRVRVTLGMDNGAEILQWCGVFDASEVHETSLISSCRCCV